MQLIVLGMHRSGTSAVTRLLNMAGAYFGPEGISNGADEGNPKGFWERLDIRAACDGLLQESGFDWWKVADFSTERISDESRERHIGSLRRIVLDLDAHRPWVVKEPRLCLLFPLLRPLLEVPVCIHVTREPLEIASSLHTRNGFPQPAGLALWEVYARRSIRASEGLPRMHVRYEDLMSSPVDTVTGLVERLADLGVSGLRVPTEREITAYIDAGLHREHSSSEERRQWMNEQQLELAAALDAGTALDGAVSDVVSEAAVDQLRAFEADRARRDLSDQLRDEVDQHRDTMDEVARLRAEIAERREEVERQRSRLDELDAHARTVADRAKATCESLDLALGRLSELRRSRSWLLVRAAATTRSGLSRSGPTELNDPLDQLRSTLERARGDLEPLAHRDH
jgi:hypothetical protein